MNGDGYDGFHVNSLINNLNMKKLFHGDAFQRFAAFIDSPIVHPDTLVDIRRMRDAVEYDTDLENLVRIAASTWCDMEVCMNTAKFYYTHNRFIRVFSNYAIYRNPRIEVKLSQKEFKCWRARFFDYPKDAA